MVLSVVRNVQAALKYRGGWKGLFQAMYTNGDYPFKFGTYKGSDEGGNRYYENKIDYPFGQHRWVEPGDIHNFDSSQVPPGWHGWLTSMYDATPEEDDEYFDELKKRIKPNSHSDAPYDHNVGYQNEFFNFNHMQQQSQIRSRGYGIGNSVVGLPAFKPESYYTQPGSPYNPAFQRKLEYEGDLDEATGGGRPYKNEMWKERLMTADEKKALQPVDDAEFAAEAIKLTPKEEAILARGGTLPGK